MPIEELGQGKVGEYILGVSDWSPTTTPSLETKGFEGFPNKEFTLNPDDFKVEEVEDRKSARDMYKDDAIIQKVLATLFTVAYFGISFVMFNHFVLGDIDLGEFEISFISTIFGAMSAKVNTIVDFFFGGSSKKNDTEKK